jgi:hypothetical protein
MGQTYDSEKEIAAAEALRWAPEVHAFIAAYQQTPCYFMTIRKNGRPVMRQVSAFVEGWTVGTITQDLHVKTSHVRSNPRVGYLWVDNTNARGLAWAPRNVWVEGNAELIEDPDEVGAFFARRVAAHNHGDAHPADDGYKRILIRTTPDYVRAEGFAEASRPVIFRSFEGLPTS